MSRSYYHHATFTGTVIALGNDGANFLLRTRSKDDFYVYITDQTNFISLKNMDEQPSANRDRYSDPPEPNDGTMLWKLRKYVALGALVTVEGILSAHELKRRVDARNVHLFYQQDNKWIGEKKGTFAFEGAHWWVSQLSALADGWLQALWPNESNNFDFDTYLTNLDMTFRPTSDRTQESATLSRLIYGLSSAFLLTGVVRYFDAAKAGVEFLRNNFRSNGSDGTTIFWASKRVNGVMMMEAAASDDANTIPLYEQIYCLAGLTQYYRITQDWGVLDDIMKTVTAFKKYFYDSKYQGWYSHLDYATLSPTSKYLGHNQSRKNWNSIGDHIPAYLLNLVLALEPIPDRISSKPVQDFVTLLKDMLYESAKLIADKFPEEGVDYVQERFKEDWEREKDHGWQQDRAIIGHNLKIAWNLTRVANYFDRNPYPGMDTKTLQEVAEKLAKKMVEIGALDLHRGGCFDAVERIPKNGQGVDFAWLNTKDFWQQEQGVLAYYILYGRTKDLQYLDYARDMTSFWNTFFLDRELKTVFFRTTDDGLPFVKDGYGTKAGHAIAGYHSFELNFLAHIYIMSFVRSKPFCLYFMPSFNSINVLPDGFPKDLDLKIGRITVNGIEVPVSDPHSFNIVIPDSATGKYAGGMMGPHHTLSVQFLPTCQHRVEKSILRQGRVNAAHRRHFSVGKGLKGKIGVIVEAHFDDSETRYFEEAFPEAGYEIEYITYLWGQKMAYYTGNDHLDPLYVFKDFKDVNKADYVGFIFIGGYAMDRIRYEAEPEEGKPNSAPAVQFLREASAIPTLKLGTICHSLWLFCAAKETLQGRQVTCAPNILYDVINAGGLPVYNDNKKGLAPTHVDRKQGHATLVSGMHPAMVKEFVEVFIHELAT